MKVTHISLVPSLHVALSEKRSGEQSQILLAYYLKVVRPNETAQSTSVLSFSSLREIQPETRAVYPLLQCQSSSGAVGKSI